MRENNRAWRIRETLKNNAPGPALDAYRKWVSPRITRGVRDHVQFSAWARQGRALRDRFNTARVSFEPDGIWVTDVDGLEWRYEPDSWMSALGKEVGWEHEPQDFASILAGLKSGGAYVDIGAHVGGFAIPVALRYPDVEVYAFEPVPRTRSWLQANLARNGATDRVTVFDCALGSEPGEVTMTGVDGVANHIAEAGKAGPGSVTVALKTLDSLLLDSVARVDVIKCDVEGAELLAMKGAEQILRRDRPVLVLEIDRRFTPRFGYEPDELFAYLTGLGYSWDWYRGAELVKGTDITEALSQTNNFRFYL